MVRITREKKGDLKFVAGGIVALIVILLIAKSYSPARALANAGFETANKVTEDLGLNDLISIPKISSNTLSLNSEKALVATFKLNKDGEKLLEGGNGDIRAVFSYRNLPDGSLRDVCTTFEKMAGAGGSSQDEANHAKGFDCEISSDKRSAVLNSWSSGVKKPAPGGEYRAAVYIKGKNDKDFQEGKESEFYRFYTTEFVELFSTGFKDCGSNCDVAGKKKAALGNDKLGWSKPIGSPLTYTQLAFNKFKSGLQGNCHLEPQKKGEARISGCLPDEVHKLYVEVVTEFAKTLPKEAFVLDIKNVNDLLKIDCNKPQPPLNRGWMDSYQRYEENGIKPVCDAKWILMKRLNELKWADKTG